MTPTWKKDLVLMFIVAVSFVFGCMVTEIVKPSAPVISAEPTPSQTIAVAELIVPPTPTPDQGEDPYEAEKIESELVEQGYFSDDVPLAYELQDIAQTACERSGTVPYSLALAVMDKETAGTFNVDAVGVDGHDIGVFQIRKSNHEWLSEETGADPLTPAGNIECGVWFLWYLYDYYDQDWNAALTCYRWGTGYGNNSDYARDVLSKAESWEQKIAGENSD